MEAGGALVGATAKEVASHVESTWERGQTVLEALRDELANDADELVYMVSGGLYLSKLRSLMHDTVSTYIHPFLLCLSISLCLSVSLSLTLSKNIGLFVNRSAGRTGGGWSWAVPPSSFVTGSEIVKDELTPGYASHGSGGSQRTGSLV